METDYCLSGLKKKKKSMWKKKNIFVKTYGLHAVKKKIQKVSYEELRPQKL